MSKNIQQILLELSKINMRNLIVFLVLIIWAGGFAYALFNHKDITESQSYSLSKLDTLITLIIGYYLKQNIKTNETD